MLKNLKSLFIVEDENASKEPKEKKSTKKSKTSKNKAEKKAEVKQPVVNQPVVNTPVSTQGKVTEKFTNVLFQALESNNLEGLDYLEFKQSLKAMNKMAMDEQTKYQSAFAMAQTMGLTKDKLIKTANFYLEVLAKEETKFTQALKNQGSQKIDSKQAENQKLANDIKTKEEQIKLLTEQIQKNKELIEANKKFIAQNSNKLISTKNNFEASYTTIKAQIENDMNKINQYL